ncbi:MAG TPA: class I SAM-dependent methyltransferase [Cyclobacteriaceae bacterium]|nr:class I SAM-dependent methyltransferase [Cyclobacteriaceae bacterium]
MTISEIQSYIEEVEKSSTLHEDKNFEKRMEVVDFIGFQVIDQIEEILQPTVHPDQEEILQPTAHPDQLTLLKNRAEKLKSELEEIDINLFKKLQEAIRTGSHKGEGEPFRNLVAEYVNIHSGRNEHPEETGYDNLDIFVNGVTLFRTMPEQTKELEPEMVYYQKTPARIVFELVGQSHFTKEDVFFDLGSGFGQVAILVNLLAGISAKGVEFEPAFCDYSRYCAEKLNLSDVTFINIDARKADYSEGTIFFMYTPFKGEILREVLAILRQESLLRKIKLITYGPCTAEVALQNWLEPAVPSKSHYGREDAAEDNGVYKLAFFNSFII